MTFHARRTSRAKGTFARESNRDSHKSPKVAICFDQAMFERIAGEAQRRQIPFARVVREKVLLGYHAVSDDQKVRRPA